MKAVKPTIFHIAKYPPPIGTRVKVWFDTKERQLLVEDETGRVTYDIYGVPLTDVVFEAETTPRGAIRCQWFAKKLGNVLCPWLQAPCGGQRDCNGGRDTSIRQVRSPYRRYNGLSS